MTCDDAASFTSCYLTPLPQTSLRERGARVKSVARDYLTFRVFRG